MFKSKICMLMLLLLINISSVCFADDRWVVVQNDSEGNISFDGERVVVYGNAKDPYVDCWIKKGIPKDNLHALEHTYIQISTLNYQVKEFKVYKDGQYIGSQDHTDQGWQSPEPNSRQERAIFHTLRWVADNKEKVIVRESN